jgi:hypothetical protein
MNAEAHEIICCFKDGAATKAASQETLAAKQQSRRPVGA